ncbi:MAG: hypothetical protein WAN00_10020, partial [Trebonia sp.]
MGGYRAASERTSPFWDHSRPAAQRPQTGILILAAPATARSSARSVRERTSSLAPHDGADWDADMLAELIIGGSLTS